MISATALAPSASHLSFRQIDDGLRGGMTYRIFRIIHIDRRLTLSTYTYPDGKLEQYLAAPAN